MRVAQAWRYPVKSMQGESVGSLDVLGERVPGDREWGVRDSVAGTVLTGRTAGALLHAKARVDGESVRITFPDGLEVRGDDEHTDLALSSYVGQAVNLVRAKPHEQTSFVVAGDRWQSVTGSFNDGGPVHVLTTASLRAATALQPTSAWNVRRFRPNVLIDADGEDFVEDAWTSIRIGDVELEVVKRTTRCPMTARSQPGLDDDLEVPRALARNRKAKLGVYARVKVPGTIDADANVVVA